MTDAAIADVPVLDLRRRRLVVVGNGMVGQRFVEELVERGSADFEVTVLGAEPLPAYDRVALSSYFDGASVLDLTLGDPGTLDAAGIARRLGCEVASIDRASHAVVLADGEAVPYDHLVLATGSDPFVPPIPGADLDGCFVYRTIADLDAIRSWAERDEVRSGVVIGGGLLGLEAANALRNLGLDTQVIEMADRLMPQQLDGPAGAMLERWVNDLGVATNLGFATAEIVASEAGVVAGLVERDGTRVDAQIVVFSAGIRPRHQLGAAAGLDLGERGGIVIDDACRTSDPSISAIGEVACHDGRVYGLVAPGYAMARTVAAELTGGTEPFVAADPSTKLKLLGVDVAAFGSDPENDDNVDRIEFNDPIAKVHRRVSMANGVIVGGVLVGDVSQYDVLAASIGAPAEDIPIAALVVPAGLAGPVDVELGDEALLCSCNNVSRGEVKIAIERGSHGKAELMACTRAGTGCGGCVPDLVGLLHTTLDDLGIGADRSLCAHFPYSRQELFDLIRFHRHASWSAVLAAHGTGRGCEVCRPAVASILASLSNGYILDGDQGAVQDTNDHALANMQRNGTYSVVPRVPGGEITPDQLIALGEIARDYDLYTKITGGQRVDLFGAQLHELPAIWQRVIDAGMESGHAYGKALRTVKSCVGDTWCRYGVQDSVSMAIRVERRYRGLRAPHKLKSAVSGCTRECAEAQSKDFGLIATETGWNLYLCGNGGRTPRHADLFATDLDDDTVIRYLDRFLMFYIRTADRLQRTASWFEELDGGLDYLRSVVIDDVLGMADELEADMARHVATYACEWTETLADPRRMKHFVEFVNQPDAASTPVWITERSQRVPAPVGPPA
ncbi:MAG: nitrite reductase large subunit NirB [Actinomycetota bacterium]